MSKPRTRPPEPARKPRRKAIPRMLSRTQVAAAVRALAAPSGTARFAAGKALSFTAERDPARVYPHFAAIAPLLDSESKIVRWNALHILASLAPADDAHRLGGVLGCFEASLSGDNLISAANAIRGLGRIAASRPDLLNRLVPAILAVGRQTYETPECRNVAIGQALGVLAELWSNVRGRRDVAAFVRRQRSNTRAAVARRAAQLASDRL